MANYDFTYTGAEIQAILDTAKKLKDSGYIFLGVATPSTNPGTPTQKVYYEANQAGTYTNFGGVVLPDGMSLLIWNGSWTSETVMSGDGGVFDISVYKSTGGTLATFADLSAALDGGNNIPASARKGGMSVKFVQSSDNNYMQFRLIANEFTTDTTQWAIAEEGVYVENPEFVYVKTDAKGKILWAIKTDGSIYYGVGVPQQVIDYINEKIAELSLDEYEDIVAFLKGLEKGDKTLQNLLDEKVDKEEGKTLIDAEYAEGVHYIENPEFVEVKVDSEERILEATRPDGTKLFGAGIEVNGNANIGGNIDVGGNASITGDLSLNGADVTVIENPEFAGVWLDNEERILFGVHTDGNFLFGCGVPQQVKDYIEQKIEELPLDEYESIVSFIGEYLGSTDLATLLGQKVDKEEGKSLIDSEFADSVQAIENPEFMEVELDAEDKVLSGRKADGTKFENNDVEFNGNATIGGSLEVDGLVIKNIEDPEGRLEISTDSEDKIISYRKADGTLVENVGIDSHKITTDSLNLSDSGMTDFQQALKNAGFQPGGGGDWSDREIVELPEPKGYAILNLIIGGLPITSEVKEGYAVYYDRQGNFFKKAVQVETQGQSSKEFAKTGNRGNYTLDFVDGDIKFGSWVPQDSFHLKGTPKDVTHGILATSYKWAYMFMEYLNAKPNRVLLKDSSKITTTNASGDRFTDWIDDARCLPDGFPVEIYVEGEYWGLYALQLKKHRKNYSIKKSDYTSLFIDADMLLDSDWIHGFWLDGVDSAPAGTTGKTWWNYFDIKGPKDLVCMDGSAFDGDHPKELIDNTSSVYDSSNKKHKGSAQAKAIIRSFSTKYLEVKELIDNNNLEGAKAKFNENFDYNACMLVYIFNCLMNNGDSIKKNTLWGTWKDGKIAPMLWDIDGVYGTDWWGGTCGAPSAGMWAGRYATSAWPLSFMWTLYQDEIKAAYAELRSHGIIDMNTWKSIVFGWANQIGTEAFDRDIERWPEMPSYRENYTNAEYWQQYGSSSAYSTYPTWDENTSYSVGDIVVIKIHPQVGWYLRYRAIQASDAQNPQPPVTKLYDACPQVGGYYDSPRRMEKWMEEQIRLCDIQNDYFAELVADFIAYRSSDEGYEIECTNMTVDTKLSKTYNFIQGHITRHEIEVEGQTVSTYTIDGGAETPEDTSKTYTTVRAAIEAAASQPVDIPSENVYYIKARAKDINYHKI